MFTDARAADEHPVPTPPEKTDYIEDTTFDAISAHTAALYPGQEDHTQATAVLKFWLGGPDPLDYISIFSARANPDAKSPAHWHYVSFGFSDISDGKGHVHAPAGTVPTLVAVLVGVQLLSLLLCLDQRLQITQVASATN